VFNLFLGGIGFLKITRIAGLILALTPLTLGLGLLTSSTPALSAPVASNDGLPADAPPLTHAQKAKQQQRIKQLQSDMAALSANTNMTSAQKQQQAETIQKTFQQDMLALLTPKQRAAVEAQNTKVLSLRQLFLKQHKAEIDKEQGLEKSLAQSITADEKAKMKSYQDQAMQQIQGLRTNTKLTDKQKQDTAQGIVRDSARDALAVLTPAQQTQFKEFQKLQTQLASELAAFAKAHHTQ
jgi:hypothetical protein